jgi:hypothetical protein
MAKLIRSDKKAEKTVTFIDESRWFVW